jgi:transcription elongation factor GreA
MLKSAKVIDEEDITTDTVSIGATAKVEDLEFGDEIEYTIVGSAEADPSQLKISNESPIGRNLIGKRVGEIVEVNVPDGVVKYKVLAITK